MEAASPAVFGLAVIFVLEMFLCPARLEAVE